MSRTIWEGSSEEYDKRVANARIIINEQIERADRDKQVEREEKMVAFKVWAKSVKWEPATKRTKLVGLNERLSR